jgi:AcrR family transcriptional regulator
MTSGSGAGVGGFAPASPADRVGVFAASVRRLFVAAGAPTVAQVAREVGVSAGTISHWRTGRHLPADFAVIEPMLAWLSHSAAVGGAGDNPGDASGDTTGLSLGQWRELFEAATREDTMTPVLRGIAEMAENWVTDSSPVPDRVRHVLLEAVSVTVTGDLARRTIAPEALPDPWGAELVHGLADLGVLTPVSGGDADAGAVVGWRLVDVRLVELWPRLHRWVWAAQRALTVRSGLEHDARWWEQSGHPSAWLYSHVRLALVADGLIELAPEPTDNTTAGAVDVFRFGAATAGQVPPSALGFWTAAQTAAQVRFRMDQIIMGLIIVLIVMTLGLGLTLAVVTT